MPALLTKFQKRLWKARHEHAGWSYDTFGKRLGVSGRTVYWVETADRDPHPEIQASFEDLMFLIEIEPRGDAVCQDHVRVEPCRRLRELDHVTRTDFNFPDRRPALPEHQELYQSPEEVRQCA